MIKYDIVLEDVAMTALFVDGMYQCTFTELSTGIRAHTVLSAEEWDATLVLITDESTPMNRGDLHILLTDAMANMPPECNPCP